MMDEEYEIIITISAESISDADQWARACVFPSEPIEWNVRESV